MVFMNELLIDEYCLWQDLLLYNEFHYLFILSKDKIVWLKQLYQAIGSKNIKLSNME
jgi:hypothetical protein